MVFGKVFLKDGRQGSRLETADKAVTKVIVEPNDKLLLVTLATRRASNMSIDAIIHETGFTENTPNEGDLFFCSR